MFENLKDFSKELQKIIETNNIYEKKIAEIEKLINVLKINESMSSNTESHLVKNIISDIEVLLDKNWKPAIDPKAKVRLTVVDED
jgi:mRNA-degrading endonuclease YafQ of YafQ-DinJ toxin-antitoxin module